MAADGAALLTLLLLLLLVTLGNTVRGSWQIPSRSISHMRSNPRVRSNSPLKGFVSKVGNPVFPKTFGLFVPTHPKQVSINQKPDQLDSLVTHTPQPLTQPVSYIPKRPVELICYITNGTHYIPYHGRKLLTSVPKESSDTEITKRFPFQPDETDTYQSTNQVNFHPDNPLICHLSQHGTFNPAEPFTLDPNTSEPTASLENPQSRSAILQPTEPDVLQPSESTIQLNESPPCAYSEFHLEHSVTLEDNSECNINRTGVPQEEREEILRIHNTLRSQVARGEEERGDPGPQPQAANMLLLLWNDELAFVAQSWANQCVFAHDGVEKRRICSRDYAVGQNVYYHFGGDPSPSWVEAIHQWYDEVGHVPYSYAKSFQVEDSNKVLNHYTQMLWSQTREVGCGAVYYTQGEGTVSRVYVCNYGPMGNTLGAPMYQVGPPASDCSFQSPSAVFPDLCEWQQSLTEKFS